MQTRITTHRVRIGIAPSSSSLRDAQNPFCAPSSVAFDPFREFHNRMSGEHTGYMRDRDIACVYGGPAATHKRLYGKAPTRSAAESANPTRLEAEWKLNAQSTVMLIDLYSAICWHGEEVC